MEKKILFTDLDGTLLRDDKTISKENKNAIKKMLDLGHYFVVTTGRPKVSALQVMKEIGDICQSRTYIIAYNGALIFDYVAGQVLSERTIPIEHVDYLFSEAKKYGLYAQTYYRNRVLTKAHTKELEDYIKRTGMASRISDFVIGELDVEPNKVLLIQLDDLKLLVRFQEEHKNWEKGKCTSFFSCNEYLEYCPSDTNKGTGVKFLCEFLNIRAGNSIGVGDERNDIPMIQAASIGIAMKNGNGETKWAADDVTATDNNHSAIAKVIEKYIL